MDEEHGLMLQVLEEHYEHLRDYQRSITDFLLNWISYPEHELEEKHIDALEKIIGDLYNV